MSDKPAKRDEIWDGLAELFGTPTTRGSRALRNKVVISLREAGADYQMIMERAMAWPVHFPGATLTPTALEKWWDQLANPPLRAEKRAVDKHLRDRELGDRIDW